MKYVSPLLALLLSLSISAVYAQDVTAPGVEVHKEGNTTVINAPGVHIETQSDSGNSTVVTQSPAASGTPAPVVIQQAPTAVIAVPAATVTSYANSTLSGMDFSNRDLTGTNFTNATLIDANFSGSNLTNANFTNATLTNANFTGANLTGATLTNASLAGANLSNANLTGSNLTNANFDHALIAGTVFNGAIMTNVNMSTALKQAPANRSAFVDAQTITNALTTNPKHPKEERKIDLTINFDFNSDTLTADGKRQVSEIATALKETGLAKAHIRVEGHTDNVGSVSYNKDLSNRRAARVTKTLVEEYGIPARQLTAKGYGKTHPIASNNSDLGRAMNRRVTLVNVGE